MRRLGFEGTLSKSELWAAGKSVGLSIDQLSATPFPVLFDLFGAKVRALEAAGSRRASKTVRDAVLKGGRPITEIDGAKVRQLRGNEKAYHFAKFCCGFSPDTLTRIESRNRASTDNLKKLVRGLRKLGHNVTLSSLKKSSRTNR